MKPLSKRDNLLRTVRRQRPQWVPMNFEWTAEIEPIFKEKIGEVDPQEHFDFDLRILPFVEPIATEDFYELRHSHRRGRRGQIRLARAG